MRRRRYNRGRWHLERERHQLSGNIAPSDTKEDGVRDVIAGVLSRLGMDDHLWMRELEPAWPSLVGPAVAAHTRPGRYQNGLLTVFVANSAWLSELMRFGQKEMLARIQARFGAKNIRSIRLQADPDGLPAASMRRYGPKRDPGPAS